MVIRVVPARLVATIPEGSLVKRHACALALVLATGCARTADRSAPERVGTAASALTWVQQQELPAANTVLVAGKMAATSQGGSVNVFGLLNGTWNEQQVLSVNGVFLGRGMAVSGDTLVVQAIFEPYVFERIGGVWIEQQVLTPINGQFGRAVAISGDTAMVGTPAEDYTGGADRGAVYVFERSGGAWTQTQRIISPTPFGTRRRTGWALAIEGDTALIGMPGEDDFRGAVGYFTRNGGTWTEQQVFTAAGLADFTYFGRAISLDGDRAVIGGEGTQALGSGEGRAFVFEREAGTWVERQELEGPGVIDSDQFGGSVSLSGGVALVGARFHHGVNTLKTGAAFVFTRNDATWSHTVRLLSPNPVYGGRFGDAVSISGDVGFVGGTDRSVVFTFAGGTCSGSEVCGSDVCADGVCCNATCTDPCDRCDVAGAEGECSVAPHGTLGEPGCGAYVCDGVKPTCPTQCRFDGDCDGAFYCPSGPDLGDCEPQFDNGASCAEDRECASGACLDGMCCNTPCTESCASCTREGSVGICSPVPAGTAGNCAPLLCDGLSLVCPERCEKDETCPAGLICNINDGTCTDGPVCTQGHVVKTPEESTHCEPYRCVPDRCLDACSTSTECVAPNLCNVQGNCVAPQDPPLRISDCGCEAVGATPLFPRWMVLIMAALLVRRRRSGNRLPERPRLAWRHLGAP